MQIKINNKTYPASSVYGRTEALAGFNRDVITMILEGTYADVSADFVAEAEFTVVDDSGGEYTYDNYGVAGPITDNRDGTCTIKMGKNNTSEQDALAAQQAAQAETAKVSQDLVTLAGKSVSSDTDISALRLTFEAAADKLSDNDAKIAPSLTKAWTTNEAVVTGDRRYFAPNDSLYKSLQDHITSVNAFPDTATDYWVLL